MARANDDGSAHGGARSPPLEPLPTFLGLPCDYLSVLGPVVSTPGYAEYMDGTQCLCTTARDDAMCWAPPPPTSRTTVEAG